MTESPSRTFFLIILSLALFGLYFFVRSRPLIFGEAGDVREIMFGDGYRGLLFAALVPAIFLLVRLFDCVAFDIALKRRSATRMAAFGESTLIYEVKYFTRRYDQRDRIAADVKKAIWYALKRIEISLPLPIRYDHALRIGRRIDVGCP